MRILVLVVILYVGKMAGCSEAEAWVHRHIARPKRHNPFAYEQEYVRAFPALVFLRHPLPACPDRPPLRTASSGPGYCLTPQPPAATYRLPGDFVSRPVLPATGGPAALVRMDCHVPPKIDTTWLLHDNQGSYCRDH